MGDILSYVNLGMSVFILILSVLMVVKSKRSGEAGDSSQNKEILSKLTVLSDRVDTLSKDTDCRKYGEIPLRKQAEFERGSTEIR